MYITEKDKKTYYDQGFVVIKNLVDCQKHNFLLRGLVKILKKYDKECTLKIDSISSWDDDLLSNSLVDFRKRQPSLFGAFYDTLQTNTILQSLLVQDNIVNVIGDLFNQDLREEFRTPWLDIIHGIDELCTLDYLKRLCSAQNDDSLSKIKIWLEQKSENLLLAMEQSRLATFKSAPYWR